MPRSPSVLIVDDDPSIRQTMEAIVHSAGMDAVPAKTGEEALERLKDTPVDIALLDVQLPGMSGIQVLKLLRERSPDLGVIMVSVVKEIPMAVEAIRLGALDYVTKDFSPGELSARLAKSLEQLKVTRELAFLREEVAQRDNQSFVVGRSATMKKISAIIDKVAATPATVLLTGESGTGKEVVARYIHEKSDRRAGPFVAVNLPALPSELIESALFGHERGAFTGALRQMFGKFELANGGTLFLDEVGELRLELQAKLLRALQEREIERVGGSRPISLDVRIVCATNRSLPKLIQEGRFREDLYWRLKVVPIELPPLRERREDIGELAESFLARLASTYGRPVQTLTPEAIAALKSHSWPGNIRELENLLERLVVVSCSSVIDEADLPLDLSIPANVAHQAAAESNLAAAQSAFEKGYLRKALVKTGWNRRKAADELGIGYSTLKAKLKGYGLGPIEEEEER